MKKWPAVLLAGTVYLVGVQASASDDEQSPCSKAYVAAQKGRKAGKLIEALRDLETCAREVCPGYQKTDCATWLGEVTEAIPTVVLGARDAGGRDLPDVRVAVDGLPTEGALLGRALPIDPGPHTLTFTLPGGAAVEERVILREHEKARSIVVTLPVETPGPSPATGARAVPVAAWVIGGVGLVGFGVFAGAGIRGLSRRAAYGCATACTPDQYDSVKQWYAISDVGLAVGVAAVGAAVGIAVVALVRTSHGASSAHPSRRGPPGLGVSF